MAGRLISAVLEGVHARPIEVEVDLLRRLPGVCIVGLAASAVRESAERVRSAVQASALDFPRKRVVINLAPADLPKEGTAFDLPIALGILAADGQLPPESLHKVLVVGELSLGGALRPVRGALALALLARTEGLTLIVPASVASEAAAVPGVEVFAARDLAGVVAHLRGEQALPRATTRTPFAPAAAAVDLGEVRGQALARRALELAAAGAHHLLMLGPPGCGKSMLARRLSTVLPALTFDEALAVTQVHSAAGLLSEDCHLLHQRPFRAPHHSVSVAGLVGDRRLRPGELSLAHHGVLFLDEAPEFKRSALEVLRAPLEEGVVRISRALGTIEHPADVTLVMAANPCPCGFRGSAMPCLCTDHEVVRYRRKLSGPLLDRVDLHVTLEPVPPAAMMGPPDGDDSATVRERVAAARAHGVARGQRMPNARLPAAALNEPGFAAAPARLALQDAMQRLGLSGRAAARVLRVARTIADLQGGGAVQEAHVDEALAFRLVPVLGS